MAFDTIVVPISETIVENLVIVLHRAIIFQSVCP